MSKQRPQRCESHLQSLPSAFSTTAKRAPGWTGVGVTEISTMSAVWTRSPCGVGRRSNRPPTLKPLTMPRLICLKTCERVGVPRLGRINPSLHPQPLAVDFRVFDLAENHVVVVVPQQDATALQIPRESRLKRARQECLAAAISLEVRRVAFEDERAIHGCRHRLGIQDAVERPDEPVSHARVERFVKPGKLLCKVHSHPNFSLSFLPTSMDLASSSAAACSRSVPLALCVRPDLRSVGTKLVAK